MNSILKNLNSFFDLHFALNGLNINPKGEIDSPMNSKRLINRCYLHYDKEYSAHVAEEYQKPKNKRAIVKANAYGLFEKKFDEYVASKGDEKLQEFKTSIAYDPTAPDELSRLVQVFDGTDFHKSVIKHWMWTAKRSMFYDTPKYHPYMLIFVSPLQGIGKSTFIDRFVAPIRPMVMKSTIEAVTDSRVQAELSRNYVVVLDELAKIERSDINELKRVLTMDDTSVRELYSHNVKTFRNQTSVIGSSNRKIIEAVYDSTGMRRFVEIEWDKAINFDLLESIDMPNVWRNVDENEPQGYIGPIMDELKRVQSTYAEREPFDEFMDFYSIKPCPPQTQGSKEHTSTDLFSVYKTWCSFNHYNNLEHKPFARKMTAANIHRRHTKNGNVYTLNPESTIEKDMGSNAWRTV